MDDATNIKPLICWFMDGPEESRAQAVMQTEIMPLNPRWKPKPRDYWRISNHSNEDMGIRLYIVKHICEYPQEWPANSLNGALEIIREYFKFH